MRRPGIDAIAREFVRASIRMMVVAGLILGAPGGGSPVFAQGSHEALLEERVRLARVFEPLAALRGELDRTRFDPTALGFELAFEDGPGIVAAVHDLVRFEPYLGLLRGAEGTLGSGAGNALDQALLTSLLLGDAGYEVEIRGTTLDDVQAARVLSEMRAAAAAPPPSAPGAVDVDLDGVREEVEEEIALLYGAVSLDVERLSALVGEMVSPDARGDTRLLEAARDYHWVAYRLHDGEPWTDAHPVFGTTTDVLGGSVAETVFTHEIPSDVQHRLRVQVFVERRLGDEIIVNAIMDPWERPVANLYGRSISYTNVPDGYAAVDDVDDLDALMAATSYFFPMLDGEMPSGGMAFDMLGTPVPPAAAQSLFGPIFQTLGRSLGAATGALGALGSASGGDPADVVTLTAQWIEFTLIEPGGAETVHRRTITDRLGAQARADGEIILAGATSERDAFEALAQVHAFIVSPGRYSEAFLTDRNLETVLGYREQIDAALVAAYEATVVPQLAYDQSRLEERMAGLLLFGLLDDVDLPEGIVSYRPAPALAVMTQSLDGLSRSIDVVANPRWSVRVGDGAPSIDARATLRAGVWETRAESVPLGIVVAPQTPAIDMLRGRGADEVRVVGAGDIDAVMALAWPRATRDAIVEDLERGYVALLPIDVDPAGVPGWWRIDLVTGETLGRGSDGRGQTMAEDLSFYVSMTATLVFTLNGARGCNQISDARLAGCCHLQNMALAGVGMLGGALVGQFTKASVLTLHLGGDVAFNVAGAFLPTFCPGG